jgi:peptidyl-prolyl cis-trans isomerase C/foldase protein PrsA
MWKKLSYLLFVLSLFISACGNVDRSAETVVITVGDRNITEDKLKKDIKRITFEMGIRDQGGKHLIPALTNRIIDNYLILEYGKINGITVSKNELNAAIKDIKKDYPENVFNNILIRRYIDFEEWKEALREQLLVEKIITIASASITPITFQEIKSYFDSHQSEYERSEMVEFRQIVTRSRDEAEKILARLDNGEDMDELARKYSISPEAKVGGKVGWISVGELDESMEEAIFSLPVGKRGSILKTLYGFHIFEVLAKRPAGFKRLPEAMADIESKLFRNKKDSFYRGWLVELRSLFPVKVDQELMNKLDFG